MKIFVAPPPSVPADDSSAAMSHKILIATAECSSGMDTRTRTADMICASRNVHVPLSTRGNKKPLNQACGLYNPFFNEAKRCTLSFFVSWISSRTFSRRTISKKRCAVAGLAETKILVAS